MFKPSTIGPAFVNPTEAPCRARVIANPRPHEVTVFPGTGRVPVPLKGAGCREQATLGDREGVDADSHE